MVRKTELIKKLLLDEISADDASPVAKVASQTQVSRQAVDKQLRNLISQGIILVEGEGRSSRYKLPVLAQERRLYRLSDLKEEHVVWRELVLPVLAGTRQSDLAIIAYGFNEMLNNSIEHSQGTEVIVQAVRNANQLTLQTVDDGVGIFKKVADAFKLSSLAEALFELSKGKLTTEPARHNGEGIFFTARLFDAFMLSANGLSFMHNARVKNGWLVEADRQNAKGTRASLVFSLGLDRTLQQVFDDHVASKGDFGFTKTHVLIKLAQIGESVLMSRSQARRVTWRLDRFAQVILDFQGVEMIGPTFADELFRVFPAKKPQIKFSVVNANKTIDQAIARTRN